MIEIYDINNGKLKYSAYTFWQLCEMVMEDFPSHTADEDNDIVRWVEQKARELCTGARKAEVLKRLEQLLQFGQKDGHPAFASRVSLLLGEIAFQDGRHQSAIEYFQKAVGLLPEYVEALHQLARGFCAVGEYEKAAEAWRKANRTFPSEEGCVALVGLLEKLKRPEEQEKALKSLLRNYPRSIEGMHMLAQFYCRRGKTKAAARLSQRIIDLRPEEGEQFGPFFGKFVEALIWSKYNYDTGKVDKVLEFLDEEQERNPDESLALLKAVMLYKLDRRLCREECCRELGRYFEAIAYDSDVVMDDLREVVHIFGKKFSGGVVRFVKNRLGKGQLEREVAGSPLSPARPSSELAGSAH